MIKKIKKLVRKKMPLFINRMINRLLLLKYYIYDMKKFSKAAFKITKKSNLNTLEAEITLHYHSIEKGLTNINFREGFGQRALKGLMNSLIKFEKHGYDLSNVRYLTGLSVLNKYVNVHKKTNIDVSNIIEFLKDRYTIVYEDYGGVIYLNKNDILNKINSKFDEFSSSRFSVRDYSNEEVDDKLINEAIDIAMKTPSVCNRQAWEVHVIKDKKLIKEVLEIQGGFIGYGNNIQRLIMITTDNNYFSTGVERNQGYIDGGMFSMSLIYALHYKGIATCGLNANLTIDDEKLIIKMLNLKESDNIIMFITIGHYMDNFSVPKSHRDSYIVKTKYY